ncbi:MAG: PD-(D/E)XK nuclease family protein [Endomicrobium sp.]|jgi:CRISPR/Cas system-associated exonuclease Cas4 (RecB family)|nr:PD-(D/E)XK nuclease family protein [Endomicrobium sp.]
MPQQIINLSTNENIIDFAADYIFKSDKKIALLSGGRRPFLFIRKKLAEKNGKPFFLPEFFKNDEFIEKIIFDNTRFIKISDIEAAFMIYEIVKNESPQLLNGNFSFASFFEWSFEILHFIEQLDLESVTEKKLECIKANAEIGYDVPENINNLLKNIFKIRNSFHNNLEKLSKTTKGYSFLKAASIETEKLANSFDEIVLIAPFYLHKTEFAIFKKLYSIKRLVVLLQGNPKEYGILSDLYSAFGKTPLKIKSSKDKYKLNVYSAFDDQSQGALLKNLLKSYGESDLNKTVVIVPDSTMLQSIISEVSSVTDKYNVSAGYPAGKTAVFSLLNAVIKAQNSRKQQYYYSRDIIKVLNNPLVKNMRFFGKNAISRIVAHKIEKAFDQGSKSYLNNKMFVSFEDIINEKQLVDEISCTITEAWKYISPKKIIKILNEIFEVFFICWEKVDSFYSLSDVLFKFLEKIYFLSSADSYPLNIEAMDILLSLSKEIKFGDVAQVKFHSEEILDILKKFLKDKRIALPGSPLKGLQILGLLEARNLTFENVFIVGMKESSIPVIKKDYSLIPKDIMHALGIEMVKKEYEIQRYHFKRLVAGAKNLSLIYPDSDTDERSRFIETIIWNKQLESKNINAVKINKFVLPKFSLKCCTKRKYEKTRDIKEYLKNMIYTYSKIDVYLNCKLKFYFKYVLLLDERREIGQELSGSDIGNFIHSFLKDALYANLDIEEIKSLKFEKEYLSKLEKKFTDCTFFKFREDAFMIKNVLMHAMTNILRYERQRTYKNIYDCEKKYVSNIKTSLGETYNLNCIIDRIDSYDKDYFILDYKTGNVPDDIISQKHFALLDSDFDRQSIKKAVKSLQLPLYKYIFEKNTGFTALDCGIYDVKKAKINFFPREKEVYEKCMRVITAILDEINAGESFEFDEKDKVNCKICPYFYMCR